MIRAYEECSCSSIFILFFRSLGTEYDTDTEVVDD